jgi:hypothetical protein
MTQKQADGMAEKYVERIIETQKKFGRAGVSKAAREAAVKDVQFATSRFVAMKRPAKRAPTAAP